MSILERRGWEITADREIREASSSFITSQMIADAMEVPIELIDPLGNEDFPCMIEPVARREVCKRPADEVHSAEVEQLWTCGCTYRYCEVASEFLAERDALPPEWINGDLYNFNVSCVAHGPGHIVTITRLRGH